MRKRRPKVDSPRPPASYLVEDGKEFIGGAKIPLLEIARRLASKETDAKIMSELGISLSELDWVYFRLKKRRGPHVAVALRSTR